MTNNNNPKPDSFILHYTAVLQDALFRVHRNVWISGRKLARSKAGLFFLRYSNFRFLYIMPIKTVFVCFLRRLQKKIVGSGGTGVLIMVLPDADKDQYLFGKKSVTVALKRI